MPLQNRVLPTGEIVVDPARGMFTGNRGCLHDDQQRLGSARWKGKAWIICALDYKGWKRQPMSPRTWTELFFLDEAVALAAGHRPCALCRRPAYVAFRQAWGGSLAAPEMDAALHAARTGPGKTQRTYVAEARSLPDGVFVLHKDLPYLIRDRSLLAFSPGGYGQASALPHSEIVVLTPKPTVDVLRAGYQVIMRSKLGFD